MTRAHAIAIVISLGGAAGAGACASDVGSAPGAPEGESKRDAGAEGGAASPSHPGKAALAACAAAPRSVDTIAAVVERAGALPKPVSVACFVASLARPLAVVATTSAASAQPAASAKSPRVFIVTPGLVLSVVPEGAAASMLELGEFVAATRTLKGELAFPVTGALAADAPFAHLAQPNGTTPCGVCHRAESAHPTVARGYVSAAYRPNSGGDVKLAALSAEHDACVASGDASSRCALFHALFDFGVVREGSFSASLDTFP